MSRPHLTSPGSYIYLSQSAVLSSPRSLSWAAYLEPTSLVKLLNLSLWKMTLVLYKFLCNCALSFVAHTELSSLSPGNLFPYCVVPKHVWNNYLVSDSGSLNQHWLLNRVEAYFLLASCGLTYCAGHGVCRHSSQINSEVQINFCHLGNYI